MLNLEYPISGSKQTIGKIKNPVPRTLRVNGLTFDLLIVVYHSRENGNKIIQYMKYEAELEKFKSFVIESKCEKLISDLKYLSKEMEDINGEVNTLKEQVVSFTNCTMLKILERNIVRSGMPLKGDQILDRIGNPIWDKNGKQCIVERDSYFAENGTFKNAIPAYLQFCGKQDTFDSVEQEMADHEFFIFNSNLCDFFPEEMNNSDEYKWNDFMKGLYDLNYLKLDENDTANKLTWKDIEDAEKFGLRPMKCPPSTDSGKPGYFSKVRSATRFNEIILPRRKIQFNRAKELLKKFDLVTE